MTIPSGFRRIIVESEDGSHTLFLPDAKEHYHSFHGALAESKHVFVKEGFDQIVDLDISPIRLLEVGFGTGLNALLTMERARNTGQAVHYFAVEPHPLQMEEVARLNHPSFVEEGRLGQYFTEMHACNFDKPYMLFPNFVFTKCREGIQEAVLPKEGFDLVYFDAFGPQVHPEMWTQEVFDKVCGNMKNRGILTTYCAKGSVKRVLRSCGMELEHPPGPQGKREMTRAIKTAASF